MIKFFIKSKDIFDYMEWNYEDKRPLFIDLKYFCNTLQ